MDDIIRKFLDSLPQIFSRSLAWLLARLRLGPETKELPEAPQHEPPVLHIRDKADLDDLMARLENMQAMREAAGELPNGAVYCRELDNILRKFQALPAKRQLAELDESSSEYVADQLIGIFPRLTNLLAPCLEKGDSPAHARLGREIEKYLASIGIGRLGMSEGAPADDWINLCMDGDAIYEKTADPQKAGTIGPIFMQPRVIHFINAYDEEETRHFGGRCVIYTPETN